MIDQKFPLRFLIIPNHSNPYDQRMVKGFQKGFQSIGHQAMALTSPVLPDELVYICEKYSFEVVIQINKMRNPRFPLPSHIRHIAWFQDIFPDTFNEIDGSFLERDIVYTLGDPSVLGVNIKLPCFHDSLATGVDLDTIGDREKSISNEIDFSLCGYIPPPVRLLYENLKKDIIWYYLNKFFHYDHIPYFIIEKMMHIVELEYTPLSGDLNIHRLSGNLNELLRENIKFNDKSKKKMSDFFWMLSYYGENKSKDSKLKSKIKKFILRGGKKSNTINQTLNFFARDYPRLLDRIELIHLALKVSNSLELYGPGFGEHMELKKFHKGSLYLLSDLLDVYQKTRINLANSTHGLGLHSRTLECMAVGGFVFMHESPQDTKPLGMLTAFEPGIHFGSFTPENFTEQAKNWLTDDKKRKWVGQQASLEIQKKHLWSHRALKVISDLKM